MDAGGGQDPRAGTGGELSHRQEDVFDPRPPPPPQEKNILRTPQRLYCYWVGSLDFNFPHISLSKKFVTLCWIYSTPQKHLCSASRALVFLLAGD